MAERERVTAYGPGVTPERVAELRAVMAACEASAEGVAALVPAGWCVLFGLRHRLEALGAPGTVHEVDGVHAIQAIPRRELAAHLGARVDDVRKIEGGPPDVPQPEDARLLVVALDGIVSVCWSHPATGEALLALANRPRGVC